MHSRVIHRAALAACVLTVASGCSNGTIATRVESPAHGAPDRVGFGTGGNASAGNKTTSYVSEAVIVAAGSDAKGPSPSSEGDFVWRVRGGMLELCEWSDDGHDDCRLATYAGFPPPPLLTFLPTIIEQGNLAGGMRVLFTGDANVMTADLASSKTQPVPFTSDRAIWITASTPAVIGAQPVFLCTAQEAGPTCIALPFVAERALGTTVVEHAGVRTSVLWVHAGVNMQQGLLVQAVDMGVFRCEAERGKPVCKKAKEVVR